jgi:hypothetical protein
MRVLIDLTMKNDVDGVAAIKTSRQTASEIESGSKQ